MTVNCVLSVASPGDSYTDLVIGTGNDQTYPLYVTGAFDEFVIWERALTPEEVLMYYKAAIGRMSPKKLGQH